MSKNVSVIQFSAFRVESVINNNNIHDLVDINYSKLVRAFGDSGRSWKTGTGVQKTMYVIEDVGLWCHFEEHDSK